MSTGATYVPRTLERKLPENIAAEIRLGAPADVADEAATYKARVVEISPEIVGGEVLIKLQFIGPTPLGLRQGQHLSTKVVLEHHPNVLKVQRGPFVEISGGEFVYVVDGNRAVRRPIRIGAIGTGEVEITDGLRAAESIVVAGVRDVSRAEINLVR